MSATTEPVATFSLGALVHQMMDETEVLDPKELAPHVLVAIPENERENLLLHLIERAINDVQRSDRGSRLNRAHNTDDSRAMSAAKRALLAVVVIAGERKTIGQCTRTDLDYLIQDLSEEITEREARRATYEKLGRALVKHNVTTLNDLPSKAVTEALR
jgi:hypothetical protein